MPDTEACAISILPAASDNFSQLHLDFRVIKTQTVHAADPDSCNNEFAVKHFNNFQRALNVYSCEQYSKIWTCANCTDAYKRWLCSQVGCMRR